ncbi:hypothetical protein DIURU_003222 [Diutina rugosa]|uniref:Dephospho-CoA kinase n=1 Tax=Diutina rugosa TaxID=5481 RepID=A0A642UTK5_DIURU|nr:uncharacterized protein DIURU_003222 [Diutina rugosa]KAA8901513.1 hypothetical protein DIURU_003222 [Diutina rugosa]
MLIVGLTGGIASGKSTVSKELSSTHQIPIIDADLIARQVVEPGKPAYNKITTEFADVPDLLLENGELNRPALGRAVFGNKQRLAVLNGITHPAVRQEIFWQLIDNYVRVKPVVVLDVPLLFEAGLDKICGVTISVSTSAEVQKARLQQRNPELSESEVDKRIASQMPMAERNAKADIVIDNNGSVDQLKQTIATTIEKITPSFWWTLFMLTPFGWGWGLISQVWRAALKPTPVKRKTQ